MGFGSPRKVPNATWNIRLASDKSFASSGRTITPACIALNLSAASLQRFGKLVQRADPRHGRDAVLQPYRSIAGGGGFARGAVRFPYAPCVHAANRSYSPPQCQGDRA